jgi:pimeloyl-ACP methyl ester carboxylesterase
MDDHSGGAVALHARWGGEGGPVLVLLHGLGATGRVWDGVTAAAARRWPGRWVAPDLSGHGRSPRRRPYSFGRYAAEVAALLPRDAPEVHAIGHSMGGVVALALASGWFGLPVRSAIGIGIRVSWDDDAIRRATALAERDVQWFATREEGVDRYLRVSGLAGLIDPVGAAALDGVVQEEAGWRLAQDPATFGVGVPDLPGLLAAARARVVLAAGERDRMAPFEELRALQSDAVRLDGLGHNAHVEGPEAVWSLLGRP